MMVSGALKVYFLICITSFQVSGISVDMASGVITQLGRKFSSGGAYLLVSSEQVAADWWTDLARCLITAHTSAAIMNLEEVSILPFPSERVPVCVMHSADMKDVSSLQKVLTGQSGHKTVASNQDIHPLSAGTIYVIINISLGIFNKLRHKNG
jgi:hypothetical protein